MNPDDDLASLAALLAADRGASGGGEERIDRVMRAVPTPPMVVRLLLALLVVVQTPIVLGWLVNVDPLGLLGDAVRDTHLVRDGAFGVVILAAAAITAWRPRWAVPSFAIASVALVAQLAAGFADDSPSASGWNEAIHLVLLVTTLVIGSCGMRLTPLGPGRERPDDEGNVVRLSDRDTRP